MQVDKLFPTDLTEGGRGRSGVYLKLIRSKHLKDKLPRLSCPLTRYETERKQWKETREQASVHHQTEHLLGCISSPFQLGYFCQMRMERTSDKDIKVACEMECGIDLHCF